MKIAHMVIENFRGIRHLELDFTDDLGRVNDLTLIVGPNGSGKTSILDAIWFGLQGEIGYRKLRDDFREEPQYVVTNGERYAKVQYSITITEEEKRVINQWKNELVRLEDMQQRPDTNITSAITIWTYPSQPGYREKGRGGYRHDPDYGWQILDGKYLQGRLGRLSAVSSVDRETIGGVYLFNQERRILSQPVTSYQPLAANGDDGLVKQDDLRRLLVDFGLKKQVGRFDKEQSWYHTIQQSYNYICKPRSLGEVYTSHSSDEYEIDFINEATGEKYGFDGLSSGERSVLNFMVQYVYKQMSNSIVLIDELELHLHPTWQRRLMQNLTRLEEGNQFIITTHSPTLLQAVKPEQVIELGRLDEQNIPDWQYASTDEGQR